MKAVRVFGLTLCLAAVASVTSLAAQEVDGRPSPRPVRAITITATDRVLNMADAATVHIGYQLYGPDKDTAYANGSRASNAIVAALKAAGVATDAIESEAQNLGPTEPFQVEKLSPAEKAARGFRITQSWTVRTNADDAARVLDLAVKAGANESGNIDWSLHDPNAAQTAAAAKALQRAQAQARAMAEGLGVHLGPLLSASNEVDAAPVRPIMRAMAMAGMRAKEEVKPLALGPRQIETSATVRAEFAIE